MSKQKKITIVTDLIAKTDNQLINCNDSAEEGILSKRLVALWRRYFNLIAA